MLSRMFYTAVAATVFATSAYAQGGATPASGAASQTTTPGTGGSMPATVQPVETKQGNPDPVKQRVDLEFERTRDSFAAPTVDIGIEGSGIALPKCVSETQEGKNCK